ncbi:hypothetical protein [Domibacillus robiginosus]|uniref:hypothetical protein n=1 Tax=Domibacillus robiginosus TaxID=1071054 RepID=UPI00067C05AF|nr:hypothetical protein [Domibacillus robiginosus]
MEKAKKKFVTPTEAIKAVNEGAIVRVEGKDGYSEIQKTKKKYAFTVTANDKPPLTYYGDMRNLKKTVNGPDCREALYLLEVN